MDSMEFKQDFDDAILDTLTSDRELYDIVNRELKGLIEHQIMLATFCDNP